MRRRAVPVSAVRPRLFDVVARVLVVRIGCVKTIAVGVSDGSLHVVVLVEIYQPVSTLRAVRVGRIIVEPVDDLGPEDRFPDGV